MEQSIFEFTYKLIDRTKFLLITTVEHLNIHYDGTDHKWSVEDHFLPVRLSIDSWQSLDLNSKHEIIASVLNKVDGDFKNIVISLQHSKINAPDSHQRELQFVRSNLSEIKKAIEDCAFLDVMGPYLKSTLEKFEQKLGRMFDGKNESSNENNSFTPIKWNGGVAALGTLFHELRTTVKNKEGETYLEASPAQLLTFLSRIFVDEKGERFSSASIRTYLDPKKKKCKIGRVETEVILKDYTLDGDKVSKLSGEPLSG